MRMAKAIAFIGFLAMTAGLVNGFIRGDFFQDGAELLANPWGIMSIIDLYVGFMLFSMWIAFREKKIIVAAAWIVLVMVLGFLTACLYVLIALYSSKGDWSVFFMGARQPLRTNKEQEKQ